MVLGQRFEFLLTQVIFYFLCGTGSTAGFMPWVHAKTNLFTWFFRSNCRSVFLALKPDRDAGSGFFSVRPPVWSGFLNYGLDTQINTSDPPPGRQLADGAGFHVLLRLPPQPSSFLRASAICKHGQWLVTDPKFLICFRARHQKPPLLGVFERSAS